MIQDIRQKEFIKRYNLNQTSAVLLITDRKQFDLGKITRREAKNPIKGGEKT